MAMEAGNLDEELSRAFPFTPWPSQLELMKRLRGQLVAMLRISGVSRAVEKTGSIER